MKTINRTMTVFAIVFSLVLIGYFIPQAQASSDEIDLRGVQISWATLDAGTVDYTWTTIYASLLERHTDLLVTPQPGVSTVAFPRMLKEREADITFSTGIDNHRAYNGLARWEDDPHEHLRLLWGGYYVQLGLFVDAGSGINTYQDIRGKRFTWNTVAADTTREFGLAVMDAMGLDPDKDVRSRRAEHVAPSWQDLAQGRTDVISNVVQPGLIDEASLRIKPKILPLPEKEIVEAITDAAPYFVTTEIVQDYTPHIREGELTFGMPYIYQTSSTVEADVIYVIVKTIVEHFDEIKDAQDQMWMFSPERMIVEGSVPYHEGAVRAYKELGMWSDEMDQYQKEVSR